MVSCLDRYKDALQVLHTATTLKKDNLKLLLRKSEVETLIRTEPNVVPKAVGALYQIEGNRRQLSPSLFLFRYQLQKPPVLAYERGCRGQFAQNSRLHCVYNSTTSPFLRLAPLKMELIALDPYMVIYHDVISPSEISELQSLAVPSLKRATVFNQKSGRNNVVKTRTSKVTWLLDTLNQLTVRLNKRITDMTGFDMYGSEMLQVMNYGLGGHYDKHFDYFNSSIVSI